MKETLIIGIGNEILTDDGIGPAIVKQLENKLDDESIHFITASVGGLEILELIEGYRRVFFIDAIITGEGFPGSVYHFTPADFRNTLHLSNLHDVNFLTALELGRKMAIRLPCEIHIIAIEIVEDKVFSEKLSPQITIEFAAIMEKVTNMIRNLIYLKI